jgi:transketolase
LRQALLSALKSYAKLDPSIFLVVGDLGHGVIDEFTREFPRQYINAGVAEQNMTGVAAGLAMNGKKVFTYSIANFPTLRALEQIRNDILYHGLPVTVVSVGTGFGYGVLGYSHHAIEDISIMRALPGLRVLSPSSDEEVREAVRQIVTVPQPTYLRLSKDSKSKHSELEESSSFDLVPRSEDRTLVLTVGSMHGAALEAVNRMSESEKKVFTVRSVWRLKPLELPDLDFDGFSKIFTIEEHSLVGGFGSAVLEHLEGTPHIQKVSRIGIPEGLNHIVGSEAYLREACGLDALSLYKRLREQE